MISKNLALRLLVAAVAIPTIIFLIFYGGDAFLYFVLFLATVGMYEFLSHVPSGGKFSPPVVVTFLGGLAAVALSLTGYPILAIYCLIGAVLISGLLISCGREATDILFNRLMYLNYGLIYIALLYPFIYLIRSDAVWMEPSDGGWWLFYLIGSIWMGDSSALLFGSQLGKRKLAPTVSPNKTIAGFVGGFAGIILISILFKLFWLTETAWYHFLILTVLIGTFGQLGDLVESLWKRGIGIKDSSNLIPGHGGFLDRFDSLLYAAPVVYVYLKYVLQLPWLLNSPI